MHIKWKAVYTLRLRCIVVASFARFIDPTSLVENRLSSGFSETVSDPTSSSVAQKQILIRKGSSTPAGSHIAYVQPYPSPKVKRKQGNVYANLTLIVFRDVTW